MNTNVRNATARVRGDEGSSRRSAARILLISGIFVAVLGAGWIVGMLAVAPSEPVAVARIRASVRLAPDELGRCQHFEWDNDSGQMSPKGAVQCADTATFGAQLDGIRHYFKSR
ncbi:MAG TPA: hypothetical protein VKB78_08145 [Pirellulales bacterium]|nr:hypothetical protein [Pirellulales bacterium]